MKHFKFRPAGKRRLHQAPNNHEIDHCRWWLDLERERVRPRLIVAMGATALRGLTGDGSRLLKRRGKIEMAAEQPVFVTIHPSYILRLRDPREKEAQEAAFRSDIQQVARVMQSIADPR